MRIPVLLGDAFLLLVCSVCWSEEPGAKQTSSREDAAAVAKKFLRCLEEGRVKEAYSLCAINEKLPPPFLERFKDDLDRYSQAMKSGRDHTSFIEIEVRDVGAVAIINEDKKGGRAARDFDPMYLVVTKDGWRVVPEITRHEAAQAFVASKEYEVFRQLEKWFDKRKEELNSNK